MIREHEGAMPDAHLERPSAALGRMVVVLVRLLFCGSLVSAGGWGMGFAGEREAVAAAAARPSWISDAEAEFFDKTGGLRPVALFDKGTGTVTIKLRKKGLSADQIVNAAIGPDYDYYKKTDLVETSFRGRFKGADYLFTGTVARVYFPVKWTVAFVPVVTRLTERREASFINLSWERVDDQSAAAFLKTHEDRLLTVMKRAGIEKRLHEYEESILENIPETSFIWGRHEYYFDSGYYIYQQRVTMSGKMSDVLARYAGSGDIKGAALKIAYQVLQEDALAGPPGQKGKVVVDFSGEKIHAGR